MNNFDLKSFVGTKMVLAKAMTLGEYNILRGWTIPENENPADDGYLVEYPDSPPNHSAFENYISWSPKKVFEDSHNQINMGLPPNEIMQWFTYAHLAPHLQGISRLIGMLALQMDATLPNGAEKSAGLRKLLEAKDCFIRASIPRKITVG